MSFGHAETTPVDVEFDHREEARGLRGPVWTWSGVVPVQDPSGPLAVEVEDLGLGVRAAAAIRLSGAAGCRLSAPASRSAWSLTDTGSQEAVRSFNIYRPTWSSTTAPGPRLGRQPAGKPAAAGTSPAALPDLK